MHSSIPHPRRHFLKQSTAAALLSPLLSNFANAEEEVPQKIDIPPYLQNPTADGMTICFASTEASEVKVFWGDSEGSLSNELTASTVEISKTTWQIWKARITGLKANQRYFYRVSYRENGRVQQSEVYHFAPFDPSAPWIKAIAVNDVHDRIPVAEALMSHVKPEHFDFSILLGDMWNDPSLADNSRRVFLTLLSYVQLFDASRKPMLFLRGNHEYRGWFSARLSHLFDFPLNDPTKPIEEQNAYYDFRVGPVWFIAPDSGEDGSKRMSTFGPYRERQKEWLEGVFATNEHAEAPWRVLATHIPLYYMGYWDAAHSRELWEPVLEGKRIDFSLSGHIHAWGIIPKGEEITYKEVPPHTPPYPIFVGGSPSVKGGTLMFLKADATRFHVRMINGEGEEFMDAHFSKPKAEAVPEMKLTVMESAQKKYENLL